jgi:glycosyltransferase involved in cell wall biosynthesis
MDPQPLVSIVTPCRNASRYIERTIESVLAQDYPKIEYIVMDGASTDTTVEILERYRGRLQYESSPDQGPTDAVNKAFARTQGSIFAWINADDEYLPGAVSTAVRHLLEHPEADVVYGEGIWTDENGAEISRYPTVAPYRQEMFEQECGICQPAAFMRREAFVAAGQLNIRRNSCFDYDLWVRMARKHRFLAVPEVLAASRMHAENDTLAHRRRIFQHNISLLREEYGYVPVNWVYGYLSFLRDGRDQYFEPLRHSPLVYLASLFVGSSYNYKHLWRYWKEWGSRLRIDNLLRVWQQEENCRKNGH